MEKELNDFKIEVLTQLAVINSELDGCNKIQETVVQVDNRSKQNETASDKPLSAKQGKILKDLIDLILERLDGGE